MVARHLIVPQGDAVIRQSPYADLHSFSRSPLIAKQYCVHGLAEGRHCKEYCTGSSVMGCVAYGKSWVNGKAPTSQLLWLAERKSWLEPLSETSSRMGAGGALPSSWARLARAQRSSAEGPSGGGPPLLLLL